LNCTTNLFTLVERPPRVCAALEVFLSCISVLYLYRRGGFAGHLWFEEMRTQSLLSDEAVTADPDFSRRIRAALVQPPAASRVRCLKAGRGAQRGPND
jgi:hypothetical protein